MPISYSETLDFLTLLSEAPARVPPAWSADHGYYPAGYMVQHNSDWWQVPVGQGHDSAADKEPGTAGGETYWVQKVDLLPITADAGSIPVYNASGALVVGTVGEPQVKALDATNGISSASVDTGTVVGTMPDGSTFQFDGDGLTIAEAQESGPAKVGTITPAAMRGIEAAVVEINETNPPIDTSTGTTLLGNLYLSVVGGLVWPFATVAAMEAATGLGDGVYARALDTNTIYQYVAAGSAYTVDHLFVCATHEAGNTRFIGVAGKYVVNGFAVKGQVYAPDIELTLTDSAVAPNMALGNNFILTLAGTDTLSNPIGHVAGQSGHIVIRQPAAGGKTLVFDSYYLFIGGVNGVVASGANAISVLYYDVLSSTEISCVLNSGIA